MEILLKQIKLANFKGIHSATIDFTKETNIYGRNATGKSTIADAFSWLLFNKNADDKADFNVKTLDSDGKAIPKIEHSVSAVLTVDGKELELRKTLREKWEVANGEADERFTGNETKYFINDVPTLAGKYTEYIKSIVDSEVFKLITNPLYFCSSLKWQDRRKILFDLSPGISDGDIIAGNSDFNPMAEISKKYEIDAYRKKLKDSISKIQKELDEIPARIDEADKSKPEPVDVDRINTQIVEKEAELAELDKRLVDMSGAFEGYKKIQSQIFGLQIQQTDIRHKVNETFRRDKDLQQQKIEELKRELSEAEKNKKSRELSIASSTEALEKKKAEKKRLLDEYHSKDAEELNFIDDMFICPTCKREFDEQTIEAEKQSMTESFNKNKADELSWILSGGKALKSEIEKSEAMLLSMAELLESDRKSIIRLTKATEEQKSALDNMLQPKAEGIKAYIDLQTKIESLQAELTAEPPNTDEIVHEKRVITDELDALKKELSYVDIIEKTKQRIAELEAQEKELANKKAKFQKELQMCDDFSHAKIEKMNQSINGLFKYVSFKLFDEQVNGGVKECCEVLIDGVPYGDANDASKVNAGLDVINTISEFYGVTAPIFIDNRESINELIDCDSQIINLIVSDSDKKLRVEAA